MSKKFLLIYDFNKKPKNSDTITTYSYDIENYLIIDKYLFKKLTNTI